jgi:ABC-type anion transport system duplicated permease subunit
MKNQKGLTIGIISVAVIALIIILFVVFKNKEVEAPVTSELPAIETKAPVKTRATVKSTAEVKENLSYAEALAKYSSKYRIQFGKDCQAHPAALVVAKGSSIMLDNRGPASEVITIGDNSYQIAGYGFKIVTVTSSSNSPVSYGVDCKNQKNVNTLTVE